MFGFTTYSSIGVPFLGNLPEIPPKHSWLKFKEWADQYGPVYRLNIAGTSHIIISSEKIANDLMRERGNIYNDRDQAPMAARLLSDNLRPLLLPYGEEWREFRKLSNHVAMKKMADTYQPLQEDEAIRMVHDLIQNPGSYETFFERYAASVIMRLAFGITLYTGKEDVAVRILKVVHNVERIASPGAYLVDIFPSLMHLPDFLASFKREGKRLHAEELDLFTSQMLDVEKRLDAGDPTASDTFAAKWLQNQSSYNLTPHQAAYVVGTLFEAASGTTSAAMMSFMLAMTLYPSAYTKLKSELDTVCGNRIPTFADVPKLPYMRACVKETLRWRPVTAGGVPHKLTARDDVYDGYLIPRNSLIHGNQWAIHRDSTLYPNADEFVPERWLDGVKYPATYREPLSTYPNLQNFSAFGFGRRICPGQNIAERSLYIQVAVVGWACEVGARKEGGRVPEGYDYTSGFNVQPKWFDFELVGREGRGEVVREAFERVWGERVGKNREGV